MFLDFETFRIDFDRRQLFRGGEEVRLSPKALQLLQLLIEARPNALSKSQILDRVWPSTFVADSNLASVVNELRRALDDDAHAPRYIRTVHAFGYAFCGTPLSEPPASQAGPVARLVWDNGEACLFAGRNIIGRDVTAAVRIDDRTISRHHAVVVITESRATIEDMQSKNGTFHDGVRVEGPIDLADGDVMEVGSVRIVYHEISTLSTATLYRK